jgi:UPF0755 protein
VRKVLLVPGLMLGLFLLGCAGLGPSVPEGEPVVFEVPKGATGGGLGDDLESAGLVVSEWQWWLLTKTADASCVKAGKFTITPGTSPEEILKILCGPPMADDVPFTVIEGWRIMDIDAALAEKGLIKAGAYIEVATAKSVETPFPIESPTLEGYLYPETYKVPAAGVDVKRLIGNQLQEFQNRFLAKHSDGFGKRSLHEIVVVASMLEREEPKPSNRPLVAGIMWKRVDRNFGLGIDATSRYTLPEWNDRSAFLQKLRDPSDPYNTRLKTGLPPTAIGNPTLASLEAAANPEGSEWLYYLHDAQGNLHPARDAREHEANRAKYSVY